MIHIQRPYISILVSIIALTVPLFAQEKKFKSVELGEIREVSSRVTGKDYELIINLPYSYHQDTTKYYPVVYFCDGYYDFPLLSMIYANTFYDKRVTECFLVGFSYKGKIDDYGPLRIYDYTPTKDKQFNIGGGAPAFLKVVEEDFIPFMEKNYRVDPSWRALGGSSAGGIFTLYALFTKPELFKAYIAISPGTLWADNWIFKYEEDFAQNHPGLSVSLFMTGAEKEIAENPEFLQSIKDFDQVLQKRSYVDFRYKFRLLDDAYHASSKPEGYTRGMQFIFEPMLK